MVRSFYGLNTIGIEFRALLTDNLHEMGYETSQYENDIWMRPAVKPDGI